jgi:hypothetical protein
MILQNRQSAQSDVTNCITKVSLDLLLIESADSSVRKPDVSGLPQKAGRWRARVFALAAGTTAPTNT